MSGRHIRERSGFGSHELLLNLMLYAVVSAILLPILSQAQAHYHGLAIAVDFLAIVIALPGIWFVAMVALILVGDFLDTVSDAWGSFRRKLGGRQFARFQPTRRSTAPGDRRTLFGSSFNAIRRTPGSRRRR